MTHDNVYGFCESKCKVEVPTKVEFDELDKRMDDEVQARGQAIAGLQDDINKKITSRQVISITDGQSLYDQLRDMNIGDDLIFDTIRVVLDDETINFKNGAYKKTFNGETNGICSGTCRVNGGTTDGIGQVFSYSPEGSFFWGFSSVLDGELSMDGYKSFNLSAISIIESCYVIRNGNSDGANNGASNLNYETWTFTLDDGSVVTKEVCIR